MILYRPTGLAELRLVFQSQMKRWPPRLPEQPIFYPVLDLSYAQQIARDWNTKSDSYCGFVTRFEVEDNYIKKFEKRVVGAAKHIELWVPAEALEELNDHVIGDIEVVEAYFHADFNAVWAASELKTGDFEGLINHWRKS